MIVNESKCDGADGMTDSDEEDVDCDIHVRDGGIYVTTEGDSRVKLCEEWRNALIIKTMGTNYSYGFLMTRLTQWAPKGHWQLVDLNNNFYIAKQ